MDPYGLIRWGDVASNAVGAMASGAGIVLGGALVLAPTGVSQVIGGVVLAKSTYSWGTSVYNLARSFDDDSSYDIPSNYQTLARSAASLVTCDENGQLIADALDLGLDLMSGRAVAGYVSNPAGHLRAPIGYADNLNSNMFSTSSAYGGMSSKELNFFFDILGGFSSYQYLTGAWQ